MQPFPHAFIFDMDGTLIDSMPFHEKAWDVMLPELGVTIDRREFFTWSAGLTNKEIFPRLLGRALSADELAQLADRKELIYRTLYAPTMCLMPGALELLHAAPRANIKIAMGTAAPPENVALIVDGLQLHAHFPIIVGGADVTHGKPNPEVFIKAAAKLSTAPEHCVVFEDTPAGIEAAFRAGMRCVAITTTLSATEIHALPNTSHLIAAVPDFHDTAVLQLIANVN
jgi:beta-phosphoglucomutase family hydrolase